MSYKENLYFIAKCLTISLEEKNRKEIRRLLQLKKIDWDAVVKVSTTHYVFPALYCNLKRVDFLQYLPQDLVSYMEYIANLNRERNKQLFSQVNELNKTLLENKITPIFLKGSGNLIAGLYEDIAERMVGDIDFICSKGEYRKVIKVLRDNGYSEVYKYKYYFPDQGKHFRRLQKENNIAAIEIHSEILDLKKYRKEFNYSFVEKDSQVIDDFRVLSYQNKLNLSIIANQINDHGFDNKTMALRNAYDVFLLSKKTNAKAAVNALDKLSNPLNCFLAACYEVFNNVDSLDYNKKTKTTLYLTDYNNQLINSKQIITQFKLNKTYIFIKVLLNILYKSLFIREYRVLIFNLLTDIDLYKRKLNQLGIK